MKLLYHSFLSRAKHSPVDKLCIVSYNTNIDLCQKKDYTYVRRSLHRNKGESMNLLLIVVSRFVIHPAMIFLFAYDYNEIRIPKTEMHKHYKQCEKAGRVPKFVENFCLDVLANRTKLPHTKVKILPPPRII